MNKLSCLEIHVYLINKSVSIFTQGDSAIIQSIADNLNPQKLFTQNYLHLPDKNSYTVFKADLISRLDFLYCGILETKWANPQWDITEISKETFDEKYQPDKKNVEVPVGESVRGFLEIELMTGQHLYFEAFGQAQTKVDRQQLIPKIFAAPVHPFKRKGGGILFINPSHIVGLTLYPGMPESPGSAWPVHRVSHTDQYENAIYNLETDVRGF